MQSIVGSHSKRSAPDAPEPASAKRAKAEEAAASDDQPGQLRPQPAPHHSWFLTIKNGSIDYNSGSFREGHVQFTIPGHGYIGMGYEGMHDPRRMRYPDLVLQGQMTQEGLEAVQKLETHLIAAQPKYDRTGQEGLNCLMVAADILAAATGVPMQDAFKPQDPVDTFGESVARALADAHIPFEQYAGWQQTQQVTPLLSGVADKGERKAAP